MVLAIAVDNQAHYDTGMVKIREKYQYIKHRLICLVMARGDSGIAY